MKRTKQQGQGQSGEVRGLKSLNDVELARAAGGDVYLHNPRGSNNRLNEGGN